MNAFVAAGAAFLIAVLWFDLMFDVQVRRAPVPEAALASISAYYRRVTTDARPMGFLVAVVMLLTLVSVVAEIWLGAVAAWRGWSSLMLTLAPIGLARVRTVPNAVTLGRAEDSLDVRTALARSVYRDHLFCIAAMSGVLMLQLLPQPLR